MKWKSGTYTVSVLLEQNTSLESFCQVLRCGKRSCGIIGVAQNQHRVSCLDFKVTGVAFLGKHPRVPLRASHVAVRAVTCDLAQGLSGLNVREDLFHGG